MTLLDVEAVLARLRRGEVSVADARRAVAGWLR